MFDYHVHTSLCNHASGPMEQYVHAALAKGLSGICFLDHLTFQDAGRRNAMFPWEVPLYVDAVRRLARKYRGRIDIRVGVEVDFSPLHVGHCTAIIDAFDFDVIGSSIHFLDGADVVSRKSAWARGEGDCDRVYGRYLGMLESMLDHDYYDVVCHLDLPKKFNRHPSSAVVKGFLDILEKIREKDLAVELNTSGYRYLVQAAFPSRTLLKRCARLQIPIAVGSDAHSADSVGQDFHRARNLLRSLGYERLAGFRHRRREMVPI